MGANRGASGAWDAALGRRRGRALQEERAAYFRLHPLCAECEKHGCVRAAVELDHVIALSNGGKDDGKKQGLCLPCHKTKTALDRGYKPKERIGLDGFPCDDE